VADAYVFRGDFRIIKLDGMFHVVFRPDSDPEWFRIVASFYTYERAWLYCDLERVTSFDGDSSTTDEVKAGTREAPLFEMPDPQAEFDPAGMARNIMPEADAAVPPIPPEARAEVVDEQPEDDEIPKDYDARMFGQGVRKMQSFDERVAADIARAADATEAPSGPADDKSPQVDLTEREAAVLRVLTERSNYMGLAGISLAEIAAASRAPLGSMSFLLESLEDYGLITKVEVGRQGRSSIYRVESKARAAA